MLCHSIKARRKKNKNRSIRLRTLSRLFFYFQDVINKKKKQKKQDRKVAKLLLRIKIETDNRGKAQTRPQRCGPWPERADVTRTLPFVLLPRRIGAHLFKCHTRSKGFRRKMSLPFFYVKTYQKTPSFLPVIPGFNPALVPFDTNEHRIPT